MLGSFPRGFQKECIDFHSALTLESRRRIVVRKQAVPLRVLSLMHKKSRKASVRALLSAGSVV